MSCQMIQLHGRVEISGYIHTLTGLHIGKGKEGVAIGDVDNPIIRDLLSGEPYIPGSSLKGKLRSLAEKAHGLPQNQSMGKGIYIHICRNAASYKTCPVCRIYGVPGDVAEIDAPGRLMARDIYLEGNSRRKLLESDPDLPFTEIKYEAAIDRVTAKANPRPIERVPAEIDFGPFELLLSIYHPGDLELLGELVNTLRLLEDDALGGSGSRGSGKVCIKCLTVTLKPLFFYQQSELELSKFEAPNLVELQKKVADIQNQAKGQMFQAGEKETAGEQTP